MATRIHRFDAGPWPALSGWRRVLINGLALVIPRANPDLEPVYEHVTYWWLEIADDGLVSREVGFTREGRPIAAAPLGDNRGIFTDLNGAPDGLGAQVDADAFEVAWSDVTRRFRPGVAGAGLL